MLCCAGQSLRDGWGCLLDNAWGMGGTVRCTMLGGWVGLFAVQSLRDRWDPFAG